MNKGVYGEGWWGGGRGRGREIDKGDFCNARVDLR